MKKIFIAMPLVLFACGADAKVDLSIGAALPPVAIEVTDNEYTPREVTIKAGQTLIFENVGANAHDIVLAEPDSLSDFGIDLESFTKGSTYEAAINKPGTYIYFCSIHGTKKGSGMAGTIVVE
jgi:plastocyanin